METKVREMRLKRLMSQEELALKSGVSRQTIIAIENGKQIKTSALTMARIAKALGCTMEDVFICDE